MTNKQEPSSAEWEVMKVIWTIDTATSRSVSQILKDTMNWENATTKTLLGRLVKKGYLKTHKEGNRFVYEPTVEEQEGSNSRLVDVASSFCNHSKGKAIAHLIEEMDLSTDDRQLLLDTIAHKTFKEQLNCSCLSGCECEPGHCTCGHNHR